MLFKVKIQKIACTRKRSNNNNKSQSILDTNTYRSIKWITTFSFIDFICRTWYTNMTQIILQWNCHFEKKLFAFAIQPVLQRIEMSIIQYCLCNALLSAYIELQSVSQSLTYCCSVIELLSDPALVIDWLKPDETTTRHDMRATCFSNLSVTHDFLPFIGENHRNLCVNATDSVAAYSLNIIEVMVEFSENCYFSYK